MPLKVVSHMMKNEGYPPNVIKIKEKSIFWFHEDIIEEKSRKGYCCVQELYNGNLIFTIYDKLHNEVDVWEQPHLGTLVHDIHKMILFLKNKTRV